MFKYLFARSEDIPEGSAAVYFGFSAIVWFVIGTGWVPSMHQSWHFLILSRVWNSFHLVTCVKYTSMP